MHMVARHVSRSNGVYRWTSSDTSTAGLVVQNLDHPSAWDIPIPKDVFTSFPQNALQEATANARSAVPA